MLNIISVGVYFSRYLFRGIHGF